MTDRAVRAAYSSRSYVVVGDCLEDAKSLASVGLSDLSSAEQGYNRKLVEAFTDVL